MCGGVRRGGFLLCVANLQLSPVKKTQDEKEGWDQKE